MKTSNVDLDYSIVAFVDILGFSEMVKNDCENYNGAFKYFEILKKINSDTKAINECSVTQFSDSVIFSLPLSVQNFQKMIKILAEYQKELFYNSIICRGAISYGKHFEEKEFMFSQGLIEAYQLECKEAIYPRIVLSKNLLEYFKPNLTEPDYIVKEKDGYFFVDYFETAERNKTYNILKKFNNVIGTYHLSVKEKYYWLFDYWEYKYRENLLFKEKRFRNH